MSFIRFQYSSKAALDKLITRLDVDGFVEYDNYFDD